MTSSEKPSSDGVFKDVMVLDPHTEDKVLGVIYMDELFTELTTVISCDLCAAEIGLEDRKVTVHKPTQHTYIYICERCFDSLL